MRNVPSSLLTLATNSVTPKGKSNYKDSSAFLLFLTRGKGMNAITAKLHSKMQVITMQMHSIAFGVIWSKLHRCTSIVSDEWVITGIQHRTTQPNYNVCVSTCTRACTHTHTHTPQLNTLNSTLHEHLRVT